MEKIELSRCVLRPWRSEDIPSLVENANNLKIWNNVRDVFPHPYTSFDGKQWIGIANRNNPLTELAIEVNGKAVGGVGVMAQWDVHRLNGEVGYWLGEPYWGRGIMSEAVKAWVDYLFERFDFIRLSAGVFEHNDASMRVLESAGFALEVIHKKIVIKNGNLLDEHIYGLRRNK